MSSYVVRQVALMLHSPGLLRRCGYNREITQEDSADRTE